MPSEPKPTSAQTQIDNERSTASLLNEAYSRLRALAKGLQHACNQQGVVPLHTWMLSYGNQIDQMADALQDEGGRIVNSLSRSAASLFLEKTCAGPKTLLSAIDLLHNRILKVYEQLGLRGDIDEELLEILISQQEELNDVLNNMRFLKDEYETFT